METNVYYGTQAGGTAYREGSQFYWLNPPSGYREGDLIPQEWDLTGPFDIHTHEPVN